jgi:ketosteroid isomerase-like protein
MLNNRGYKTENMPTDQGELVMEARKEVMAAERDFAKSMADRDIDAFAGWLSEEAIFFTGPTPLWGKAAVLCWWSRYFTSKEAPFSWDPDQVEVVASRTLALSTGPVRDPAGNVTGRFNSIWRREASGWRVVFDKGSSSPAPSKPQD